MRPQTLIPPSRALPLALRWTAALCAGGRLLAADIDENQLPPAASVKVDFVRDIKPILESHCYKCHGGEKVKSGFRLSARETALKGGEHGVDILPGQSAKSPLIHYVARLVEDMEMPPEGRGVPLTAEEVGLLRAWIDQGVTWEAAQPEVKTSLTASPIAGWTGVGGDVKKFRELNWQPPGWNGGLEEFELKQKLGNDSSLALAGHVLRDDYKLTLEAQKDDLGFARAGWSQFRKYSDDSGGYFPLFSSSIFSLNRDLFMDIGRAWVDLGLALPRWPRVVLGYEYQYRDGAQSTLHWGPVTDGSAAGPRNLYPAFEEISEQVHILKLDLDYEIAGVLLADNFRAEWSDLNSRQANDAYYRIGATGMSTAIATEQQGHFQGANTFRLEKQFTDWLFASAGYLYSRFNGDGALDVSILDAAYLDPAGIGAPGWHTRNIELRRDSHVFSVSGLLGPWEGLTLSLGTQNEWTRQSGLAGADVSLATPSDPLPIPLDPEVNRSQFDRATFTQNAGLRFTKIPFTTLFADARFQQESIGQSQEEAGGLIPFLLDTDARSDLKDYRAGFNTSPWRRVSLSGHYRRYDRRTDYNNFARGVPGAPNANYFGYPGFIRWRDLSSDEIEARLTFRPAVWLQAAVSYQYLLNRYHTATDPVPQDPTTGLPAVISPGGSLLAGSYDSQIASANVTFTRWTRLFLSATLSYQHTRTSAAANGSAFVAPYEGDIYGAMASATYRLGEKTDLVASYSFSTADFAQNNFADTLPLGIKYQQHALQAGIKRRLGENKTIGLQYRFYHYTEPSSRSFNDFTAHAVFATFTYRLP